METLRKGAATAAAALFAFVCANGSAQAAKRPNIMPACTSCHTGVDGSIRGKMVSASPQFKSFSVTVGPLVWVLSYGDDLKVKEGDKLSGTEALKSIPRDKEVLISYTGEESKPFAVQIAVKQPYKVAAEKLISVEQMKELVAKGPEQGKFFLFDSRPMPLFAEARIPYAQSLPYANLKEQASAKLPADKEALLVFYCGGET